MCIIASLPPKSTMNEDIDFKTIKTCWVANPDGGGFMYLGDDGNVKVVKGLMKFKEFYNIFIEERNKHKDSSFVLHFRIASKGTVNKENTHPFMTHEGRSAIVHNGTITHIGSKDTSDTSELAKLVASLPEDWPNNNSLATLIKNYIGTSRLCILTKTTVYYIGEGWIEEKGIYYSNNSYIPVKKEKTITNCFLKCSRCKEETLSLTGEIKIRSCISCMTPEELEKLSIDECKFTQTEYIAHNPHQFLYDKNSTQICKMPGCGLELNHGYERTKGMCSDCITKERYADYHIYNGGVY